MEDFLPFFSPHRLNDIVWFAALSLETYKMKQIFTVSSVARFSLFSEREDRGERSELHLPQIAFHLQIIQRVSNSKLPRMAWCLFISCRKKMQRRREIMHSQSRHTRWYVHTAEGVLCIWCGMNALCWSCETSTHLFDKHLLPHSQKLLHLRWHANLFSNFIISSCEQTCTRTA